MQFIGAVFSISRRQFFAEFKIRASKPLNKGTKSLKKKFRKITSVGLLPLWEIRNAFVVLLDEETTRTLFFRYPELRDFYPAKSGILQSPSCVCLSVCLFVSRISQKRLGGF